MLTIPAHSPAASPRGCRVTGSFTETISAVPDRAGTPCMAAISSASGMHQPCEEAPRDAGSRQVLPWPCSVGNLAKGSSALLTEHRGCCSGQSYPSQSNNSHPQSHSLSVSVLLHKIASAAAQRQDPAPGDFRKPSALLLHHSRFRSSVTEGSNLHILSPCPYLRIRTHHRSHLETAYLILEIFST